MSEPPTAVAPSPSSPLVREYRKGNWTIQETLILITAKKLDDERRLKATSSSSQQHDPTKPACSTPTTTTRSSGELRWKWVENYCWSQGCLRSQNQCNDKWDNLLRDYKKVRDYESKSSSESNTTTNNNNKELFPSYWTLNKQQRKEHSLPSNMASEVYQAISEVLQRKQTQTPRITTTPQQQPQQPQPVPIVTSPPPLLPPPPPPPLPPPPPPQAPARSTPPPVSGNAVVINVLHSSLTHKTFFFFCF